MASERVINAVSMDDSSGRVAAVLNSRPRILARPENEREGQGPWPAVQRRVTRLPGSRCTSRRVSSRLNVASTSAASRPLPSIT